MTDFTFNHPYLHFLVSGTEFQVIDFCQLSSAEAFELNKQYSGNQISRKWLDTFEVCELGVPEEIILACIIASHE